MSTDQAVQALILAQSGERDLWETHALAMWRSGYAAGLAAAKDSYERGYTDAQTDLKTIQHGTVLDLRQHLITWDGPREHFSDPRPTDIQPAARRAGAA